jgi:hypothetical protein
VSALLVTSPDRPAAPPRLRQRHAAAMMPFRI